jgi:SRP-independent targeting protein 2/TMEM208
VTLIVRHISAQEATANAYLPILASINVLYILLLMGLHQSWTAWNVIGVLTTWAFQIFAYLGILESAKNNNKNKNKDLVGGAHLDLLALTVVVQMGSAVHSYKWFYLLWIVPIYGGWWLYSTFGGGTNSKGNIATTANVETGLAGASQEKREKRALKRAQKRG